MNEKTQINLQKRIIGRPFKVGNPGGPGRPKLTQVQKIIKKAEKIEVKKWIEEYEQGLAKALPKISPVLIALAKKGNIPAIAEIHKVIGAYKRGETPIVPIQINFNDARDEFE